MMASNKWNDAEVIKRIKQRVIDQLTLVGEYIEGDAKLRCPVDLGNLRNSINYKVDENELSVIIGTNVEYAAYVEFGTGEFAEDGEGRKGGWFYVNDKGETHFTFGNKPQPYLRPALLENEEEIKNIMGVK